MGKKIMAAAVVTVIVIILVFITAGVQRPGDITETPGVTGAANEEPGAKDPAEESFPSEAGNDTEPAHEAEPAQENGLPAGDKAETIANLEVNHENPPSSREVSPSGNERADAVPAEERNGNSEETGGAAGRSGAGAPKEETPPSTVPGSNGSSTEEKHEHKWAEQTTTVHHKTDDGHYETVQNGTNTVVDQEAWDEVFYKEVYCCSECGFETGSEDSAYDHIAEAHQSNASFYTNTVQAGSTHHPAVTHEEPVYEEIWIDESREWDEIVVTGYICTECGATK